MKHVKLLRHTACAFAALVWVALAPAQTTDAETWARAIVDAPLEPIGNDDAIAASWFDLIAREPDHPLVEATMRAFAWLDAEQPRQLAERLASLDPQRMQPIAAGLFVQWRSAWRPEHDATELLARASRGELLPGYLRTCKVLGPLTGDCDSSARAELFASPGFDREHAGVRELALRWLDVQRSPDVATFALESAVSPEVGWAISAFAFDVPKGGPGWIEIDCSEANGPQWLLVLGAQDRDWRDTLRDPSFAYAVNGGAAVEVDFLARERSLVERAPVSFRNGRNRLLIASNLGAQLQFAVRALDASGRPLAGLVEARDDKPLGAEVGSGAPPPLKSSESYLLGLASRGPDTEALLAMLEMLDGRPSAGLARLKRAVDSAPDRVGLQALLSHAYANAPHVPDSWKRGRARELAEKVVAAAPQHGPMQLALARVLAPEDKEEEALALLGGVADRSPHWAQPKLEQAGTYARLDLDVPAERALFDALQRAPEDPSVLDAVAGHLDSHGSPARALELRQRALGLEINSQSLQAFAGSAARAGRVELAEASYRAAVDLGATWQEHAEFADFLEEQQRYDEADAKYAELEQRFPYEPWFALRRADLARLRGDDPAEVERLRETLRREPSNEDARTRLFALTGHEPARDFEARYALDVDATLASFDASKWNDSVVRIIDAALVYVFEDGGFEQLDHTRNLVRDLQGCEAEGKQSPRGEVLEIATIKAASGVEHEPAALDGEYVMPSLEPGDSVEIIQRNSFGPPDDGVVRLGEWSFASVDAPFHLSRYVVSVPKALGLRMVLRNFAGEHRVIDEGAREVHVFEVHEHPRVLLEPASPPPNWILPWVQFGRDRERDDVARLLAETSALPVRVTPEIQAAAARAIEGIERQEDQAQVLYALVSKLLDKRAPGSRASALAAMLSREGNGTWLYAALLEAAGIPHDVVWSRDFAPAGDPEPEPAFVEAGRWMRKLFVLVEPNDGPPAWCDLASRTLPYGVVVADSPGASAFAAKKRAWIETPDVPLRERAGRRESIAIVLDGARGAAVEVEMAFTGNIGHAQKERLREIPKAQRKRAVQSAASMILAGIDVAEFDMPGLDSDREPVSLLAKGKIKSFLDEAGGELACKLPFPPLKLGNLVAGEGERKYPFFLPQSTAFATSARFELPEGWKLARPLADVELDFRGGSYRLVLEQASERAFTLRRELYLPPMVLEPAAYPEFVDFAKSVDAAERARLAFVKPQ